MLVLLVLLLTIKTVVLAQSQFIPLDPPRCTFSNGKENDQFYSIPASSTDSTSCSRGSSGKTCCKQEYLDLIGQGTDLVKSIVASKLDVTDENCLAQLAKLYCIPCAEDSFVWSENVTAVQFKVDLCADFCTSLLRVCNSSVVKATNRTVLTQYGSGELFCYGLFQASTLIVNVRPTTERACFDSNSPECTADDIVYNYGECFNGKRDLQYNWKPRSTCRGGIKLPHSLSDLACPISCGAGSYLPLGQTVCRDCPAGTFSLGGGHRIQDWRQWPTRFIIFDTFCQNNNGIRMDPTLCAGWSLNGTFIDSNIAGRANTRSVLQTTVKLYQNGTVTFIAKVDGETGYDQLRFSVDGVDNVIPNSFTSATYTFPLSPGFHTLTWAYKKDATLNVGTDKTMIYSIEVTAMSEHSDECTACVPGTYSTARATACQACGVNTITNTSGASVCISCPADQYSFPGDSSCTQRQDCTTSDMQYLWSACSSTNTRTKTWSWIEPHICRPVASLPLPPPETNQPCALCNPGYYREAAEGCVPCLPGQWSNLGNTTCFPCGAGQYAPKQLSLSQWDEWPNATTTHCSGDCGTTGWRLRSTFADSGENHGSHVDVTLVIPVQIEAQPFGSVKYDFMLQCTGWCYLEFWDGNTFLGTDWNTITQPRNTSALTTSKVYRLTPGAHNLTWVFGKFFSQRNGDKAQIDNVVVQGVDRGGAGECLPCHNGTFSTGSTSVCTPCPPGKFSSSNATSCSQCPDNTYQDKPQQGTCKPCGHDTYTPPGSAKCSINNCQYSILGTKDVYDFNDLTRQNGEMWGPFEADSKLYYLNPCHLNHQNTTCRNENGSPMETHACQVLPSLNYSIDLGHIMGFYPYVSTDATSNGVVFAFTEGTPGCGQELISQADVPRRLNVTIICDPLAGVGSMESTTDFPLVEIPGTYPDVCSYALQWRSIYGCPLCREDHYEMLPEVCKAGEQTITYRWKTNPKACHGGIPLPPSIVANCTTTATCSLGTKLSAQDTCIPCQSGEFSLGNGEVVVNWTNTEGVVKNDGWVTPEGYESQLGPLRTKGCSSSVPCSLRLVRGFQSGLETSIEFDYTYTAYDGSLFVFYVDGLPKLTVSKYTPGYQHLRIPVSVGTHDFRWEYNVTSLPSPVGMRQQYVQIKNVQLRGTTTAVTECYTCKAGEVSNIDMGGCHDCPLNTYALVTAAGVSCEYCPPDKYLLVGPDSTCLPRPTCGSDDFVESYPNIERIRCGNPNLASSLLTQWVPLDPTVCKGNPASGRSITTCIPCPNGTLFDAAASGGTFPPNCAPCPTGTYLASNKQCKQVDSGFTSVRKLQFFHSDDIRSLLPDGFTTYCTGSCSVPQERSGGWRPRGNKVDSGINAGEVETVLNLAVKTDKQYVGTPKITFTATYYTWRSASQKRDAVGTSGLEVYIDGVVQSFPYAMHPGTPYTVNYSLPQLPNANNVHQVMWVYSQSPTAQPAYVVLQDVTIEGTEIGIALEQTPCVAGTRAVDGQCIPCPPKTHAPNNSMTECLLCPAGTISPTTGSKSCIPCGPGTISANDICLATCLFNHTTKGVTYDLRSFKDTTFHVNNLNTSNNDLYEISPCGLFAAQHCRYTACREQAYAFGLLENDEDYNPRTLGTFLQFVPFEDPEGLHTFDLVYTLGTNLPPGCSAVSTTIQFYCDTLQELGTPKFANAGKCSVTFSWRTARACHVCLPEDIVPSKGTCKDGVRQIVYNYQVPCFPSGPLPPVTEEKCAEVSLSMPYVAAIVLGALVLLVSVGGLAVFFYRQRRATEIKYQALRTDAGADDEAL